MDKKNTKIYSSNFILLFVMNLFFFCCYSSLSLLPPYLSSLGATNSYIGFFMNIPSLELALLVFIFGKYSNIINTKKTLYMGYAIFILSTVLMFVYSDNLIVLLILRIFNSLLYTFGFIIPLNFVNLIIPNEKRVSGLALYGISGALANPVGTFLSEIVIDRYGYNYLFLFSLVFPIICLFLLARVVEPHAPDRHIESISFFDVVTKRKLFPAIFLSFVFGGAYAVMVTFIPKFYNEKIGFVNLSYYFTTMTIVAVVMRLVFLKSMDSIPIIKIFKMSTLSIFLATSLLIVYQSFWMLPVVGLIYGIGQSLIFPALSTAFVRHGNDSEKNIYNNSCLSINTFGCIVVPSILGIVGDVFGTVYIFISSVILIFFTFFIIDYHKDTR